MPDDTLFDIDPEWRTHWQGMPEFVQHRKSEHQKIIVRFDSEKDVQRFAELIGQKLTSKTKSIWFPFKSHWSKNR